MSESVSKPKWSPSRTRTHETSASAIVRAASATVVSGVQKAAGRCTSEPSLALRTSPPACAT